MRHNPHHAVTDQAVVRRLIAENPWATIVSSTTGELVASHYPVLLDERDDGSSRWSPTSAGRTTEVHGFGDGPRCC